MLARTMNHAAIAVALIACSHDQGSKPASQVRVSLEPSDRMTLVRGSTLRALVGIGGATPSDEQLDDLRSRISLISANGKTIEVSVEAEPDTHAPQGRFLEITPADDLASEWHEMRVHLKGTDMLPFVSLVPVAGGTYMVRFHPDSAPVLQSVRYCSDPTTGNSGAVVIFSEPVDFVPTKEGVLGEVPLHVRANGISCAPLPSVPDDSKDEGYNSWFEFGCGKAATLVALTLSVTRPLKAASGKTATFSVESANTALQFDAANGFDDLSGGCIGWHMP